MEAKEYLEKERRVYEELEPGERVLWRGKPKRPDLIVSRVIPIVVEVVVLIFLLRFGISFLQGMPGMVGHGDKTTGYWVIGGTLVVFGTIFTSALLGLRQHLAGRNRLEYVVTDRKLLILDDFPEKSTTSLAYEDVAEMRLEPALAIGGAGGLSNIRVEGRRTEAKPKEDGEVVDDFSFQGIEQGEEVLRVINEAREKRLGVLGKGGK
jgi:hypothetical protein